MMGCQKLIEVDNACKLWTFYEKCLAPEAAAYALGEERKGYMVWIGGRNRFLHKAGCCDPQPVHLLLSKGHFCNRLRSIRERKNKSAQGMPSICQSECSQFGYCLKKKRGGEKDIFGCTCITVLERLVPQRAGWIHKFFNLYKEDDVPSMLWKAPEQRRWETLVPKIQCYIIPPVLQDQSQLAALKKQCTN